MWFPYVLIRIWMSLNEAFFYTQVASGHYRCFADSFKRLNRVAVTQQNSRTPSSLSNDHISKLMGSLSLPHPGNPIFCRGLSRTPPPLHSTELIQTRFPEVSTPTHVNAAQVSGLFWSPAVLKSACLQNKGTNPGFSLSSWLQNIFLSSCQGAVPGQYIRLSGMNRVIVQRGTWTWSWRWNK